MLAVDTYCTVYNKREIEKEEEERMRNRGGEKRRGKREGDEGKRGKEKERSKKSFASVSNFLPFLFKIGFPFLRKVCLYLICFQRFFVEFFSGHIFLQIYIWDSSF